MLILLISSERETFLISLPLISILPDVTSFVPPLYKSLGVFLPLITTNCAVLGVTILNIDEGYTYAQSLVASVGAGVGFLLAMILFAGLREKLAKCEGIPQAFQGVPIVLVTASILSLSFMGFGGVIEGLFK